MMRRRWCGSTCPSTLKPILCIVSLEPRLDVRTLLNTIWPVPHIRHATGLGLMSVEMKQWVVGLMGVRTHFNCHLKDCYSLLCDGLTDLLACRRRL